MSKTLSIDDLYTDTGTFDQQKVLQALHTRIVFTKDNEILFTIDPTKLKARDTILLYALAKKQYPTLNEMELALLMEFILHGLSGYSMISKKVMEGKIEFKDLMGSMLNMGSQHFTEEDFNETDLN